MATPSNNSHAPKRPAPRNRRVLARSLAGLLCAVALVAVAVAVALPTASTASNTSGEAWTTSMAPASASADDASAAQTEAAPSAPAGETAATQTAPASSTTQETPANAVFDPTVDDANAFGGLQYESGVTLVRIAPQVNPDQAIAQIEEESGIQGLSLASTAGEYIELALPKGQSVADAVEAFEKCACIQSAQPNFRYFVMDDDPEARLDAAASALRTGYLSAIGIQGWAIDDTFASDQWALDNMNVYEAWELSRGDLVEEGQQRVTVAALDDCFNGAHPDLQENIIGASYAQVNDSAVTSIGDASSVHGTHVAGVIAAQANNGIGVAGVTHNGNIMPIRVSNSKGGIATDTLVRAYDYIMANAAKYNVRVINISLGAPLVNKTDNGYEVSTEWGTTSDDAVLRKIDEAWDAGIVTVAAAGNAGNYDLDGNGTKESYVSAPFLCWPGDHDRCVTAIALQRKGDSVDRYSSSSYNLPGTTGKNISAPGASIYSTRAQTYGSLSGTSMATPCVSGVLALMFTINPSLTCEEVVSRLYASATDIGSEGWDEEFGYGAINALAAVQEATVPEDEESDAYYDILDVVSARPHEGLITQINVENPEMTYTGKPLEPRVTVYSGYTELVEGTDYVLSYGNNIKAGTATVTATGVGAYSGSTRTAGFSIAKAANTLKVKAKSPSVKFAKTRTAKQVIARKKALTVSKAKGSVAYTKIGGSKYLSIAKKTGKISVKKGVPRGTYKIKIRVKAAGNANYKSATQKVIVRVKVK